MFAFNIRLEKKERKSVLRKNPTIIDKFFLRIDEQNNTCNNN